MATNFLSGPGAPITANGSYVVVPVEASANIYQYAHVCYDSSGYIVRAADVSGNIYAGVTTNAANNASGAAGAISVTVETLATAPYYAYPVASGSTGTQAWVGVHAFIIDDSGSIVQAATSVNKVIVGRVIQMIDPTLMVVDRTDRYALATT
jgi:hypothetical protein